jgi:hypothetical protein
MELSERVQRLLAYSAVAAVWLFAGAVGVRIGLDIGRAAFA